MIHMNKARPFALETTILIMLAMAGTVLFFALNAESEAEEIPTAISRSEAVAYAAEFLQTQIGVTPGQSFATFQSHDRLSGFLQKEQLDDKFAKLFPDYPIDYYEVELADYDGMNKFVVDVDIQTGAVFGWSQTDAMTNPADRNDDADLNAASSWLAAMGYNPKQFQKTSEQSSGEWVFSNTQDEIGGAFMEIRVSIQEGAAVEFAPSFRLPQEFDAWMSRQQQAAQTTSLLSLFVSMLLAVGSIVAAVRYKHLISFSRGILLTLAFTAIYVLHNINMYPGFRAMANDGWSGVYMVYFTQFTILLMGAATYLSFTAGDGMWKSLGKNMWPNRQEPSFGKKTVTAMWRGYLIAVIILGVQAVLFNAEDRLFDIWFVADPTSSTYNLFWPALFPLLAWAAAISEEAVYRLFGIALFKKLVRNTFLAVLIPSFFWAMGHVGYPIYPFYTRLIEVTVLGLVFGFAFLRYGLPTAIFAHASMDSILMGISVMYQGGASNAAAGVFYLLSPALVAAIVNWLHKRRIRRGLPLVPAGHQ